jgi:hypothetical protein
VEPPPLRLSARIAAKKSSGNSDYCQVVEQEPLPRSARITAASGIPRSTRLAAKARFKNYLSPVKKVLYSLSYACERKALYSLSIFLTHAAATAEDNADLEMPSPFTAMEGMKGNMAFMVQNMVMMQAIQHFFSGFILLKVPFSLTTGFKQMFQKGLEMVQLDTSYVSSVSWYFLVMFGLRGFFRLVIGTPSLETQETQQLWAKLGKTPGASGPGAGADDAQQTKALNTEADNMELMLPKHFKSNLDAVEKRLLKTKYPKKKSMLSSDDFLLHGNKSSSSSKKSKKTE